MKYPRTPHLPFSPSFLRQQQQGGGGGHNDEEPDIGIRFFSFYLTPAVALSKLNLDSDPPISPRKCTFATVLKELLSLQERIL